MHINIAKFKKKAFFHFPAYVIIVLLAILAGKQCFGISKDAPQYMAFFESVDPTYVGRFEPIFVFLTLLVKYLTDDFSIFLTLIVLLSLSIKVAVLNKYKYFWFSFLIYLLILFPLHELTQYRVSLALALLYACLYILYSGGSRRLSWCLFFCAVFTHYSTIALLPLVIAWNYFQWSRRLRGRFLISIAAAIGGIVIIITLKKIIFYYAASLNETLTAQEAADANILSGRNIILFAVLIIGMINIRKIPDNIKPFWFISLYGFILWVVFIDIPIFAHRLFEITFFSYLIWISFLKGLNLRCAQFLLIFLSLYLSYRNIFVYPLLIN